jgi:leader peptidase (prepilin peptidase)/N-methyltransferase
VAALAPLLVFPLLGAVIGSFLNVVIERVPLRESIVTPRSRCPVCGHAIRPYDNVPLLSWLLLRARCRDCDAPIPARYPLVELTTALAFAAVVVIDGVALRLLVDLPLVALLIAVAAIDLDHRIVPNRLLAPAAVYGFVALALIAPASLPEHLAAGAGAFALLLVAALARPGGMGMGDVKLAGVLGLYLGIAVIPALLVAFAAGAAVGIALMLRHGAAARKRALPFAPFLALGGIVGLLAGSRLIALYASAFLT